MKYFILAFKRIADFQGRSSRKEFFMTYLFYILFTIPFILLKYILFMSFGFKNLSLHFLVAYSIVCKYSFNYF
ncbi:MAG: DUF805 domain-containing protein [Saprospiraceae bacterium]|nr:DUF805 domain-containing protein [Saprospiraceae bacterium]